MTRQTWLHLSGVAILAMILMMCFSYFWNSGKNESIDPPQVDYLSSHDAGTISTAKTRKATLFVEDPQGNVVPWPLALPQTDAPLKQTLQFMAKGGPSQSILPEGFTAVLPAGSEVLGINVIKDQKLAIVDFSAEFTQYDEGHERSLLEALTWAVTQFPEIELVQLRVEGMPLRKMPKNGTPLEQPLSRAIGINIEKQPEVPWSQAIPVTIYRPVHHGERIFYFVPTTQMMNRTEPLPNRVLQLLIDGRAKVLAVEQDEESIRVNLDHVLFTEGMMETEKTAILQAMALSLGDYTEASKLHLTVGGKAYISDIMLP